jgi:putative FmdB family regulatory protein
MPIFDLKCPKCGHTEPNHLFGKNDGCPNCPKCDAKMEKLFGPADFIFKGSGFYSNDYPLKK